MAIDPVRKESTVNIGSKLFILFILIKGIARAERVMEPGTADMLWLGVGLLIVFWIVQAWWRWRHATSY